MRLSGEQPLLPATGAADEQREHSLEDGWQPLLRTDKWLAFTRAFVTSDRALVISRKKLPQY